MNSECDLFYVLDLYSIVAWLVNFLNYLYLILTKIIERNLHFMDKLSSALIIIIYCSFVRFGREGIIAK